MNFKKISFLAALSLPCSVLASPMPMPSAPTMNTVSSLQACQTYAQGMKTWIQGRKHNKEMNLFNSLWFRGFSRNEDNNNNGSQSCNNGVCTNYYDDPSGGMTGCYVIAAANLTNTQKTKLLNQVLIPAYTMAIAANPSPIINTLQPDPFGFYGPASGSNICVATSQNQYSDGCHLYIASNN